MPFNRDKRLEEQAEEITRTTKQVMVLKGSYFQNPKVVDSKTVIRKHEDKDDSAESSQYTTFQIKSMTVLSIRRFVRLKGVASCSRYEEVDEEEDMRLVQDSMEVSSMVSNGGGLPNIEEHEASQ